MYFLKCCFQHENQVFLHINEADNLINYIEIVKVTIGTEGMDKTDTLIAKIISQWSGSDRKEAVEVAALIEDVLKHKKTNRTGITTEGRCSPPDLANIGGRPENEGIGDIVSLLR